MTILLDKTGAVATVTISQPKKYNAVSPEMWDMLADTFTRLSDDDSVRCVILRGDGKAFCSGSDLEKIDRTVDIAGGVKRLKRANRMILAIHTCEKPVISSVRGVALGVGWSLSLAADLSIASESAKFVPAFTNIGLVPDGGAVWFLSRLIGARQALKVAFLAEPILPPEALELGLINQIAPDDTIDAVVAELAGRIAERPTLALSLTKRLFRHSAGPSLAEFLESEELAQNLARNSSDFNEGVAAFGEKRPPKFTGR